MTEGLFLRFMAEERGVAVGVNERLMDLTPRTFTAIHLGCSSELFRLLKADAIEIMPNVKGLPSFLSSTQIPESVNTILAAAKRLGYCFATNDLAIVMTLLRVRI
jgi:hypothetical protein